MNGIVVSGIGIVTPLGASREKTWTGLLNGKTAVQRTSAGLEARVFDFSLNGARSRMGDFALLAAEEALRDAGFDPTQLKGRNIGCAVSQSKPLVFEIPGFPKNTVPLPNGEGAGVGQNRSERSGLTPPLSPPLAGRGTGFFLETELLFSSFFGWSAESVVQREFRLEGPTANLVAACATGIASIQAGAQWISAGLCDIVLVGAAESSLNEFYRAGFQQMGVLADEKGPRPFDRHRTGFVMGEGAAVMVLESERSVRARGKTPLAKLLNAVMRQSPSDILRFDPDGDSVAALIKQCLGGSGAPGYINAHGTGTLFNDLTETRGIKKALGEKAKAVPVSSTKAATGHLLGAAGAVEAAFAVLALRDQAAPPTLNLTERDPECDLDYVSGGTRQTLMSSTMSLSYGFGGQMGAVHFGKI